MQIERGLRDQLATIAERDFQGVALGVAVQHLVREHQINRIMQRYEELRADPEEWAGYQREAQLTDHAVGDGLADAYDEYPEYQQ